MGVNVVVWNRYGHRRTYVNDDDGTSLGYRDEKTGTIEVAIPDRADDVRRALGAAAPPRAQARVPAPRDPEQARHKETALAAGRARRSWHAPTLSEKALADELVRSSPFAWAREVPWDGYRLDFFCAEARLAVEVDGSSHRTRAERDAERDTYFRRLGIETMRVAAGDVEHDPAAVVARINRACIVRTGVVPPLDVPAPGPLARLLRRTQRVTRSPLAPDEYAGRRRGGVFVCAGCREEHGAAQRSRRSANCCTACAP